MHYAIVFVFLLAFVFGLGLLARRLGIPYPILFVIGGLCISFVPHLPHIRLDPDFVFFIFLPPLLYMQAFNTSWRDFRFYLRPILLLAIGLVVVTTVTVAYAAHWLIPGMPLSAGLVLGAIISPPDAIAASAIAQRLGLPRRVVTILEGESLVNDATSLVLFKLALIWTLSGSEHFIGSIWTPAQYLYIPLGGLVVGLGIGWVGNWLRARVISDGAHIFLTISLLLPYASYLLADEMGLSGVLAVVATGLYIGRASPEIISSGVRLESQAVWEIVTYLLNGMVFVLIGLQLPGILGGMENSWWPWPVFYALLINLICIVVRMAWVFPGAYVPRLISKSIRKTEPCPEWRQVFIIGWSGMRGIVSLAAALALNGYPDFPHSRLIQFIAFSVILVTLVFQGLTLPPLIRYLGVGDEGDAAREEIDARNRMAEAVFEQLDHLRGGRDYVPDAVDRVEQLYRLRTSAFKDDLADQLGWSERRHLLLSLRRLHRTMISVERRTLLSLRRDGHIGDDVLHKIEHELDLEEARLKV